QSDGGRSKDGVEHTAWPSCEEEGEVPPRLLLSSVPHGIWCRVLIGCRTLPFADAGRAGLPEALTRHRVVTLPAVPGVGPPPRAACDVFEHLFDCGSDSGVELGAWQAAQAARRRVPRMVAQKGVRYNKRGTGGCGRSSKLEVPSSKGL